MEYRISEIALFGEPMYIIEYSSDETQWVTIPKAIENPVGEIFETVTEAEEAIELLIADFGGEYLPYERGEKIDG